jgi:sortase B
MDKDIENPSEASPESEADAEAVRPADWRAPANGEDERKGDKLLTRALFILGILLLVSAFVIGGFILYGYLDAQMRYREIETIAGLKIPKDNEVVDTGLKLEDIHIDWAALNERNPDIVGWIIVPGTRIDYPVVMGADNEEYLYRLFDSSSSGTGTIFADYQGSPGLDGANNVIYGHNMLDGSMFADLLRFTSQSFLMGNQVAFLATPERNYELRPVATLRVQATYGLRVFDFAGESAFATYRDSLLAYAVCKVLDIESVRPGMTTMYTLVTCDNSDSSVRILLSLVPVRSLTNNPTTDGEPDGEPYGENDGVIDGEPDGDAGQDQAGWQSEGEGDSGGDETGDGGQPAEGE